MGPIIPLEFPDRNGLREWFVSNHESASECWVVVKRGTPDDVNIAYLDAVEEALCFGWIDNTVKKLEDGRTVQRFSPRRRGSSWTQLNIERCHRLERLGLMTDAGRSVIPKEPFVVDEDVLSALKSDRIAWENFSSFPEPYRRIRIDNVQHRKGTPDFDRRLEKLIRESHENRMYGNWDDSGRLSERGSDGDMPRP